MASVLGNYAYHSSCFVVGMACATAVATAMASGSLSGFYTPISFIIFLSSSVTPLVHTSPLASTTP
jgi:hypothetical protein